jgi:beta-galactosidase
MRVEKKRMRQACAWIALALGLIWPVLVFAAVRTQLEIAGAWRSVLFEAGHTGTSAGADGLFQRPGFDDSGWASVSVPHNWQGYGYARQAVKGTRHGTAWYRKRITIPAHRADQHVFLMFEGVNAYATVWLNGEPVGRHGGGLTSFTLDVTKAVRARHNVLSVRVDNPAGIRDLPWVPGDDSDATGFAEGSQPFGIFRPVHVIVASALKIQPFGIYAWGRRGDIGAGSAKLTSRAEVENRSGRRRTFEVAYSLIDASGHVAAAAHSTRSLKPGESGRFDQPMPEISRPHLWSPQSPYLYRLRVTLNENGKVVDRYETPYGIRYLEIARDSDGLRRLLINGNPFALHGIAEYEHLLGGSHAFSPEQITARVRQVRAAGFNAFRDAHYPHNLRYQAIFAREGLMWWPQFGTHIWFDNPDFRSNFLNLLADWVRERRNNPANFMWGLQNESSLPRDFTAQALAVIRDNDPTASIDRLVVTCNGGNGADWNVPQNWSGTYGGDPDHYADELKKQGLVGEYGGWRSLGQHQEAPLTPGRFDESSMTAILETKSRLAAQVRADSVGDFVWLLATHENPGRPMLADGTQIFDGIRPLEHIGPANNKGLMTLWGEPLDAYYLMRAREIPASRTPVVYIVSHTWPDRWTGPGVKSGIQVFSNCDRVELFNDVTGRRSFGARVRSADGRPFVWNNADVRYNVLSASCWVGDKVAARDVVTLNNLPPPPDSAELISDRVDITKGAAGQIYLYRVNAGGPDYIDTDGQRWLGDRHLEPGRRWGWRSWADDFSELDPALGSRRVAYDPVEGTSIQALFRTYRFGRERLGYSFAVPNGDYDIELYFVEPWYGRTGIDATGWRLFDVALNGRTALRDLDIFKEAGFNRALKKVVHMTVTDGHIEIRFPRVAVGQAVISAIAIAAAKGQSAEPENDTDLIAKSDAALHTYLDNGDAWANGATWSQLSSELLDSDWLEARAGTQVTARTRADLYLGLPPDAAIPEGWTDARLTAKMIAERPIALRFATLEASAGEAISIPVAGPVLVRRHLPSPYAPGVLSFAKRTGLMEAETAASKNGAVETTFKGYGGTGYVQFNAGPASLTWSFSAGIAARRALTIRYRIGEPALAKLTLTDESGIVAAELPIALTAGNEWQTVTVETPTLINAGNYRITLNLNGPAAIDSLTVM